MRLAQLLPVCKGSGAAGTEQPVLGAEQHVPAPAASTSPSPSHPAPMPWGKLLLAPQPSGASPAWEVYTEPTPQRKINPKEFLLSCICLLVLAGRTHAQKASAPCSAQLLVLGHGSHSLCGSVAALLLAPERIGRSLPGTQPTEPRPRPQEGAAQPGAVPAWPRTPPRHLWLQPPGHGSAAGSEGGRMPSPSWGHRCSPGLCFTCSPASRWGASACPAQGRRFAQCWTLRAPVLTI